MNKNRYLWLISIAVIMLANLVYGGTWTPNQFIYQPSMGARGETEYNNFNTGMKRVDNHLGKFKTLGDPGYATLAEALTTIGGDAVTLNIPAGAVPVNTDTTVPANVHLRVLKGADFQVAEGATLTINGTIEAGPYQIFSWTGSGAIKISATVPEILVDWFIPSSASDHTIYIKKALLSTLPTSYTTASAIIFTKDNYNIANLTLDAVADGIDYGRLCLIGRPTTHRGLATLTVTGANNNGILITGNPTTHAAGIKDFRIENLEIRKDSYPGDNNGDFGLKLVVTSYGQVRNCRFLNWGGAALEIHSNYYTTFEDVTYYDCYRGIQFNEDSYNGFSAVGCQFVNNNFVGCKTYVHATGTGVVNAHWRGGTSDDHGSFTASTYIDILGRGKELSFTDFWFEGLTVGSYYVLTLRPQTSASDLPGDCSIKFSNCKISSRGLDKFVTYTDDATATITLNKCSIYQSDVSVTSRYENLVIVPNHTSNGSNVVLAGITDTPDKDFPSLRVTTPSTTYGPIGLPRSIGFFNGETVESWDGQVSHRFFDDTHLPFTRRVDGFRSTILGLWAPTLRLQQGSDGYGSEIPISCGATIPVATTCDANVATPYKLTNIGSISQFSAGDKIRITGAGPSGEILDTYVVFVKWDGTELYIKNPVQTTASGTGLSIVNSKGAIKINTDPSELGSAGSKYVVQGWRCVSNGTPGTWLEMRTLTGN